ncbi:hypothetical protein [Lysobacter capsici]|uniref:hypothetical protein n=1 Tax=Lysobacter capsici TaxID=435897 RepID=UPI0012FE1EB4|nr:hypothetical protein [Lysobacter capsici]
MSGVDIRASHRRATTLRFSRGDKFSPLLTSVCDADRYSHETNPFAREKTDRRSPETNPKSSQPFRELQRACERTRKHAVFREKRDARRVVRIIRDTVDGCIKSFTYPSCDPALTARFVNTRLVIRLSPISMDTA